MAKRRRRSGGSKASPKANPKRNKNNTPSPRVVIQNQNQNQSTIGDMMSVHSARSEIRSNRTATNVSDVNGFGGPLDELPEEEEEAKVKLPPLMVKSVPLATLQRELIRIGIQAEFKLCGIGIKVMLHTKSEYVKAKNYLDRAGAEYFSHDLATEKPFKAVVRGLPLMSGNDIASELAERYKLQPVAVFPMTRKDVTNKYRDCLYLVHFKKGTVTLNALKAVRSISSMIVSWEPYRGTNRDVTQCMRCLNFGHGTRNCHLQPRCNNCGQVHLTSSCPAEGDAVLKCIHCGEGHRSTDKQCRKREEYKQIRKRASQNHQPGRKPNKGPVFNNGEFPLLASNRKNGAGTSSTQQLPPQPNPTVLWSSLLAGSGMPLAGANGQPAQGNLLYNMPVNPLNIVLWNARGLSRKRVELCDLYLPGFNIVRLDRTHSGGGGVALAIRKTIKYIIQPHYRTSVIEAVGIEVSSDTGKIIIIAAYCPTQCYDGNGMARKFKNDLAKLTRTDKKFILACDLNAKHETWRNIRRNKNGCLLFEDLQLGYYTIHAPYQPTYLSPAGISSTLDIVLSNFDLLSQPVTINDLSSDHFPVSFQIGGDIQRGEPQTRKNYHDVNWVEFARIVDRHIDATKALNSTEDIDEALSELKAAISVAENHCVRQVPIHGVLLKIDSMTKAIIRQRNKNNDILVTPFEKATAIGEHILRSHNLGNSVVSPMEDAVRETMSTLRNTRCYVPENVKVKPEQVAATVKASKNMKAPGFDSIFNLTLKKLSHQTYTFIANVFNRCLDLNYFPSEWKIAKVVPLLKPSKDPTNPSSYRPISLLSSLSKLFERLILDRVLVHIENNNIFLPEQFGFRKGHSTTHQLQRVVNIIDRNKHVAKSTAMALLDVEKAFDNVWHEGLIYKMYRYNFPVYLIKIVQNYLSGRSFKVSVNGTLSNGFVVPAGVPQGSILGPVLYNVYTSDFPRLPDGCQFCFFADDTAILCKGRVTKHLTKKLQNCLDSVVSYMNSWKIKINASKTQAILFPYSLSQRLTPPADCKIVVDGLPIDWSNEVVYLGLTFDQWDAAETESTESSDNTLNLHENATSQCVVCKANCSSVASCNRFVEFSSESRWAVVMEQKLCRKFLRKHNGSCNKQKTCGKHKPSRIPFLRTLQRTQRATYTKDSFLELFLLSCKGPRSLFERMRLSTMDPNSL
ncbi:uncharacterized protein LOC131428864 [Malaya genurostris]|uniref:uncharacterized protein LOC131428864 n=1 Tax=Malaya genurostris TaxID=325434 RepID=UPI0026F3A299|nr:uncharacterized protein LOC131428864 [Malaya genurostris]